MLWFKGKLVGLKLFNAKQTDKFLTYEYHSSIKTVTAVIVTKIVQRNLG